MPQPTLTYYNLSPSVTAFSTTRHGGFSQGAYGEFNINRFCGDNEECINKNLEALSQTLGISENAVIMPHQTHGTEVRLIAKDFLAFAKLSEFGNRYEWEVLGFDPIRTSLWTDPTITENPDNKYLQYFLDNPFDILNKNGIDLTAPNIRGGYSAAYSVLCSTTYVNAFEMSIDTPAEELLANEQATIIYY